MIVRGQCVALVMVQSVAISTDAGHEDVTVQIAAAGPRGCFHVRGRGAMLPIVHVVVNDVELLAGQRALQRLRVIPVDLDIGNFLSQIVTVLAMQDADFMAGAQ